METPAPRAISLSAGLALAAAGVSIIAVNAVFTPLIDPDFATAAVSPEFLARQSLSAFAALMLLFGAVGLDRARRPGIVGSFAYTLAFVGSALLLATEWTQIWFVRDVGLFSPETLRAMETGPGFSWSDIGALISFAVFSLGWLLFALVLLLTGAVSRLGAGLVVAGLIVTPMLGAFGVWGPAAGSVVLGAGWISLGVRLMRPPESA
jgi:hypothetical protein